MDEHENLTLVKSLYEAINARDWDKAFGYLSNDHLRFEVEAAEPMRGLSAYREFVKDSVDPFPDMHVEVNNLFGSGEWVCDEHITSGTFTNPMRVSGGQSIPPNGKKFKVKSCHIYRVKDRKITETRVYFDPRSVMAQLGLGH